ncbi:MAG: site-specific DNA-methyltransferase [Gemmatimonadetes bacterium]|nr:site-specific DNA-methyltransferase [Gemmatimonadota bacterium]
MSTLPLANTRAEVVLGDCIDVLHTLDSCSVDAVVTDPPYCSGGFSESARRMAKGQGLRSETIRDQGWFTSDNMGTAGMVWMMRAVALEAYRVLRDGSSLVLFTDWRQVANLGPVVESSGFRWTNMVVWDKGSAGLGSGFRAQHELALHFTKGSAAYHDRSTGNVIRCSRQSHTSREHQTQTPIDLMARLIRVVCPVGGVVLDPFAGSGSTGVAALLEGRGFLGIEREAAYVEIARRRLAEVLSRSELPKTAADRMQLALSDACILAAPLEPAR